MVSDGHSPCNGHQRQGHFFEVALSLVMKNKFIITISILLLSLSGISYADVLNEYGVIAGTADVSAPEFYIDSVGDETLLTNEKPFSCGGSAFGISGTYRTFKTKDLGGVNFGYIPGINFQVRAKGITVSTSSLPKLGLAFGYYDGTNTIQYLGSTTFSLGDTMGNYSFSGILASKKPEDVHRFFYEFKKICPSDDASCSVSIDKCDENGFYTKVELSK